MKIISDLKFKIKEIENDKNSLKNGLENKNEITFTEDLSTKGDTLHKTMRSC